MEYVEVGANATQYVKPKNMKKGEAIEGIYRGSFEDKYNKNNHRIQQADGITKVINGTTQLDNLLADIEVGTPIKVIYGGANVMKSGKYQGKEAHSFKLLVAKTAATTELPL